MVKNRLSVKETAALMNVSEQFIRVGLQQNKFPWGIAIKMSSKWTYYVNPVKFTEETGIEVKRRRKVRNIKERKAIGA